MRTSDSDRFEYRDTIRRVLEDENMFNGFKQLPEYRVVLEHVSHELGMAYWEVIKKNNPQLMKDYYTKFVINDLYGNPLTSFYDEIGTISPSTVRYVKVLSDIINLGIDLTDKNIIEIGGGYGGQCLILSQYFKFKEYTIVDLPEPLGLTKKYLNLNNITNVYFKEMHELDDMSKYYFVISNYALTECTYEVQKMYHNKIIKNSEHGYITGDFSHQSEIFTFVKDFSILNEHPLTGSNNKNLIW